MYNLDGSTPNDVDQREFSEKMAEDLASLNILAKELNVEASITENSEFPQRIGEQFSPIHGYIVTENNIIMRRHSSTNCQKMVTNTDKEDADGIRKILSAPPSMTIIDEPKQAHNDLDAEVAALTSKNAVDFFDNIEVGEDLVNESFSKYFLEDIITSQNIPSINKETEDKIDQMALQMSKSMDQLLGSDRDSPIDNVLQGHDSKNAYELKFDTKNSARYSLGSLNTVNYIDPENSMTTEALQTPGYVDETEFVPTIEENSGIRQNNVATEHDKESYDKDEELEENMPSELKLERTDKIAFIKENSSPEKFDHVSSEEELDSGNVNLEADSVSSEENNLRCDDENMAPDTNHGKVERHPSFNNSLEIMHHHSILDRILKDDFAPRKQIVISPSYTLEQPCAVGITKKFPVMIENKTDLWVQCSISVDEVGKMNGFSSQNRLIIPPLAEESLPVCLSAKQDGLCLGTVEVAVNSVISGMLPEQYHSCKITAIAELPGLSMLPKQIQFSIQVENKEASYELTNSSDYELPLKVVLHSEGLDEVFSLSDPMSKYPTAVFTLVLPPHQLFVGHIEFCPYEQYSVCKGN